MEVHHLVRDLSGYNYSRLTLFKAPLGQRSSTHPSPLFNSSFSDATLPERPPRRQAGISTAPSTPGLTGRPFPRRNESAALSQGFKFPAASNPSADNQPTENLLPDEGTQSTPDKSRLLSPRTRETS